MALLMASEGVTNTTQRSLEDHALGIEPPRKRTRYAGSLKDLNSGEANLSAGKATSTARQVDVKFGSHKDSFAIIPTGSTTRDPKSGSHCIPVSDRNASLSHTDPPEKRFSPGLPTIDEQRRVWACIRTKTGTDPEVFRAYVEQLDDQPDRGDLTLNSELGIHAYSSSFFREQLEDIRRQPWCRFVAEYDPDDEGDDSACAPVPFD